MLKNVKMKKCAVWNLLQNNMVEGMGRLTDKIGHELIN